MQQPVVKAADKASSRIFFPLNRSEVETGLGPSSPMTESVQRGCSPLLQESYQIPLIKVNDQPAPGVGAGYYDSEQ